MTTPLAMSVIILAPDDYATIRQTLASLAAQTVVANLELIIVAPSKAAIQLPTEAGAFGAVAIVEVGKIISTPVARIAGARTARAPLVAFVEDHAIYDPQWAEALIDAHRQGHAVVGGVFGNANPASLVSWANLLTEYGEWMKPAARTMHHLPGHNSSYKKEILLAYGSDLEAKFVFESVLHWELLERGYTLFLEPRAKVYHLNYSRIAPTLQLRFYSGAVFAGARSRHWSIFKRLAFAAGAPLIPLVRFVRTLRNLRGASIPGGVMPRVLPWLVLFLIFDAVGEMVGYARRVDDFVYKLSAMEYRRERYLTEKDRQAWLAGSLVRALVSL